MSRRVRCDTACAVPGAPCRPPRLRAPNYPPSAVTHPCPAGLPAPSRWLSLVQVVATPYWPAIAISHLPNGGTRPRPSPAPGAPPSAGPARRSAPRTPVTTVLSRPADPPPGAWLRAVVTRCCPGYLVLSREPLSGI